MGYTGEQCEKPISGMAFAIGSQGGIGLDATSAVPVGGDLSYKMVKKVDGGMNFSLVLTTDGEMYGFGSNQKGQLGGDNFLPQPMPKLLLTNVVDICAGWSHSIGVQSNGAVIGMGYYVKDSSDIGSTDPITITGFSSNEQPIAVVCGHAHTLILTNASTVYAVGDNGLYQLGVGTTGPNIFTAQKIYTLSNIVQIAAGHTHSLALNSNGELYAWGSNDFGQLGYPTPNPSNVSPSPVGIPPLKKVVAIAAGFKSSYAVTHDGSIFSWGSNDNGQLGDSNVSLNSNRTTPGLMVQNLNERRFRSISCGRDGYWCIAWTLDGTEAISWGLNQYYQLGDGTNVGRITPVNVTATSLPAKKIVTAAAATFHGLYILDYLKCFGIASNESSVCSRAGTCRHGQVRLL